MEKNKNNRNTLLLTVIAVATLLVAVIGATFAYFTAQVDNAETASTVTVRAAQLWITFEDGTGSVVSATENIEPSVDPLIVKKFTLTPSNDTDDMGMPYTLNLVVTRNSFTLSNLITTTSISYKLLRDQNQGESENGMIASDTTYRPIATYDDLGTITTYTDSGVATTNVKGVQLGNGFFPANSTTPHRYKLEIYFMEDDTNQDEDRTKQFAGYIDISTGNTENQIRANQ